MVLGVTVLTSLALAVLGLFAIGSNKWTWSDAFYLRAGFADIHGIDPGSRVRVKGEDAGEVEEILSSGQPSGDVTLKLRLQRKFRGRIRTDAYARIVNDGLMGGKVVEIHPGSDRAEPMADHAKLETRPTRELGDLADQVGEVLKDLHGQKKNFGELIDHSKAMVRQGEESLKSMQDVAEAVKRLPGVRSYVEDPLTLLYRPGMSRNRKWFAEADLFPPGQARLTAQGEKRLNELVPWLSGLTRHSGAEVVVVAYADPKSTEPAVAQRLTREQSEAVANYLKKTDGVYRSLWMWSRKVTPYGRGSLPPPVAETENLPPARIEILVFVPQG
jgi:outer membrane protein OmpA-like peptidoglycan-associated protein